MNEMLKLILSLSLSGSILAVLIFAVKPFTKQRIPKSIQYYIWLVVLLRLLLPFSFETSLMNKVFSDNRMPVITSTQVEVQTINSNNKNYSWPNVKENVVKGVYNGDSDHSRYFRDLFNQYVLYLWLVGVIIVLAINLIGYIRFLKHIKIANKPATEEEKNMLITLLKGRNDVELIRNHLVSTPMLIGILRPRIIIPDIEYDKKQLKYILLHEITHLRRFDIVVKWLTMLATSIHWFNPLMHFINKEINHACELACDEAVIKNLNPAEKQAYGDTLISLVAEYQYPSGVLQVTMCEEKKSLKERLLAIMKHSKKSKFITISSIMLVIIVIMVAWALGASSGNVDKIDETKVVKVTRNFPLNKSAIELEQDTWQNIVKKINNVKWSKLPEKHWPEEDKIASNIVITLKREDSVDNKEYILWCYHKKDKSFLGKEHEYALALTYDDLTGKENIWSLPADLYYELRNILVASQSSLTTYDYLMEIAKYKTPYVGNNSKVAGIAGNLPAPDKCFRQRYTSMITDKEPYKLTIYYEVAQDEKYEGEWPIVTADSTIERNSRKNALIVFSMVDNLAELSFAYRNSPSTGDLDKPQYDIYFTFQRSSLEEKFGDLSVLGENLNLLSDAISKIN